MSLMKDEQVLKALRAKKESQRLARREPPPSVEDRYEDFLRGLLRAALESALQRLSADDRELVEAAYKLGPDGDRKSVSDLAETRGCDRSTLYRKLPTILLQLREAFRDCR